MKRQVGKPCQREKIYLSCINGNTTLPSGIENQQVSSTSTKPCITPPFVISNRNAANADFKTSQVSRCPVDSRSLYVTKDTTSCSNDKQLDINLGQSSIFVSKYLVPSQTFHLKKALSLKYAESMKSANSTSSCSSLPSHASASSVKGITRYNSSSREVLDYDGTSRKVASHPHVKPEVTGREQLSDSLQCSLPKVDPLPDHSCWQAAKSAVTSNLLTDPGKSVYDAFVQPNSASKSNSATTGDFLTDPDSEFERSSEYSAIRRLAADSFQMGAVDRVVKAECTGESESHRTGAVGRVVKAECRESVTDPHEATQLPHTTVHPDASAKPSDNGLCQVCSDSAAGFYCGAFVCEACKKFFIRASKQQKQKFVCLRQGTCKMTKESRVQCQFCRYQKCLELQMYYPGEGKKSVARVGVAEIPCRVCGAPSSGFHFGALTCEGCKGFFRRMVKEREPGSYRCSAGGVCDISLHTRNMCKACRYDKCISIGMSVEGSRIGRQPNAVKHAISLEVQKKGQEGGCEEVSENSSPVCPRRASAGVTTTTTTSTTSAAIQSSSSSSAPPTLPFPDIVIKQESQSPSFSLADMDLYEVPNPPEEVLMKEDPDDVAMQEGLQLAGAELARIPLPERALSQTIDHLCFKDMPSMWKKMMLHFEFHAQCIIRFAKKVPDFRQLHIDDQVALVQHATYPLVILNHARGYDLKTGYYNYFNFNKMEEAVIFQKAPIFSSLVKHFKHTGLMAKTMNITDMEYVFLSCMVLLDTDCPGLVNETLVHLLQSRILHLFEKYEEKTHEHGSSRFGELLLRLSELTLASVQHGQIISSFLTHNPDLSVPGLFKEMYFSN